MKISASVYSNREKPLEELVAELDRYHVDYFHIDCNDDPSVFKDIERIRQVSKTPIDLHIISPEPSRFFDGVIKNKVEQVSFQYEKLGRHLDIPKDISSRIGLALVSETPLDVFERYSDLFDFVLFMTTTPGRSGGVFNKENFARIRNFKTRFPSTRIQVDGGVNDEISFVLRNMGVSLIVSGSYLVNANYIGRAIHQLRSDGIESHIRVADFMMGREELHVLQVGKFGLKEVLQSIEKAGLGFTTVVNEKGKLEGIITNADVRRGLIKFMDDLNRVDAGELINRTPAKINSTHTVSEMLQYVKNLKFPVLFLPVVNEDDTFAGAVMFNNLIKGES